MNKQMLNTYFEDKPEMTAKVSKSLKMTLSFMCTSSISLTRWDIRPQASEAKYVFS